MRRFEFKDNLSNIFGRSVSTNSALLFVSEKWQTKCCGLGRRCHALFGSRGRSDGGVDISNNWPSLWIGCVVPGKVHGRRIITDRRKWPRWPPGRSLKKQIRKEPRPELDDTVLLHMIRSDLSRSPFRGEGHQNSGCVYADEMEPM